MLNVYINPKAIDGIRRVIEAQIKYLPHFGVQVTPNLREADVICNHGTSLDEMPGIPSVHVGHGFMWSRQPWGDGFMEVNRQVVESMRHAVAHTAPSEWVSRAIRRGGYWYPEVVYHGVDAEEFSVAKEHQGYVLWNKARADFVSDPGDMLQLAERMQDVAFYSTIGSQNKGYTPPVNLKILGVKKYDDMKSVVSNAAVYLSTARETFGIGTLEALACGVPVAGWDWGGNSEIILQGETGYLAPPGDYQALQECVRLCLLHRDRLSNNARTDALTRWRWEGRIEQYANIFKRVYTDYVETERPKVSVVVTAYKLDEYLPVCLDSVQAQTMKDFECLVVDDAQQKSTEEIVRKYAAKDRRFRYTATPQNLGLVGSRNLGVRNTRGFYIRHLDADDYLSDQALAIEAGALDRDRGVDIVYGHLEVVRTDGTRVLEHGEPVRGKWPPDAYNWYHQLSHLNQMPSCVMARREVYERSGGYRTRMKRQEDAEFWCRVTSLGFRAEKVTQAVTYFHRERHDSKGALEWENEGSEPDWTGWFPWRMGASNFEQARDVLRTRGETPRNSHLVPFGAQGKPPRSLYFWYVHDYAYPVVSVIVTVGPGHEKYLLDALDSIQAQTYPDWECVVVNDTGREWDKDIMGAPWAKVVSTGGNKGAAYARNFGVQFTKGKQIVWMDADDYWLPWFLEKMMIYAERNVGVIFSDLLLSDKNGMRINRYDEFHSERIVHNMQYPGSSILVPREIVESMISFQGGFDEQIPGMEDWDYQISVHHLGYCAFHVPEPLFVYRLETSTKREVDHAKIDQIVEYVDRKWAVYRRGDRQIMCSCNSKKPISQVPQSLLSSSGNFSEETIRQAIDGNSSEMMVRIEYVGTAEAPFSVKSQVDRSVLYRFSSNPLHRERSVFLKDAQVLLGVTGPDGKPQYRVISNVVAANENDPAAFLGTPITA